MIGSALLFATSAGAQASGLVAAYAFNETSGTTTADASGLNNTGTLGTGVTRTATGRFGGGLVFNGTNGKVTIPNAASLTLTSAMTLEAWVNPTLVNGNWRDIVYKGNDNYYLMATTTNSSRPAAGGTFGGASVTTEAYGTAALVINTWTHLAVTYDGATLRLYVNGTLVSSVAQTGALATSTNALTIGGDAIYGQYFKGTIDEVRVYNRALSAAEVQTDMNTAIGPTGPDTSSPTLSITVPTAAATYATNATSVTLSGTAADNVGVTQVTWTNSAGGASGTATGTTSWSATGIALQPGANVLTVTARDAAGNVGTAVLTVTSDPVVPTVAITSPTSAGTFTTSASPIALGGTAGDNVGVTQVTWANNRGGSGTATGTTSWTASGVALQTGINVVTVTARDAVGNLATSTLTVTYTAPDITAPTVSITSPTTLVTYSTNASSVTLSGSAADNVGVTQVTWTNSAGGGSGTATGTTSWSATGIALQPGANVLTVTAQDAAGNVGTAVLTVTSDAVVPTVAITSPTAGATFTASASPIALGGTAGDNVGVTQVNWSNNRGGSGTATGTTSWTVSSVALQSGDNVLTVTARDAAGNVATGTLTVTYTVPDNTAPTVSITSPTSAATYATNAASVTVGGSAADNVGVTQVTWTNSAGGSGTATGTTSWSASGVPLQPGSNVITVTARDAANNPATATLTITQDAVMPAVTITAPAAGTVSGSVSVIASATDNVGVVGVQFLLDGATLGAEVTGAGPTYSTTWNTAGVVNGSYTLTARARDAAGNSIVSAGVSVTVSNVQPSGLVAAYGFNETSGTTTSDASPSNNTGTLNAGVTRTTSGRFGGGLTFNGTNGMVTVPNAASLGLTTAMTLEAWVNPSVVSNAWRDVVYKGNDNYYLMATTTSTSRPAGGGTLGAGTIESYGTAALAVSTWTHLAVSYDGAAIRLYVNGTQVSTVARTGAIATSTNPLTIGGDPIYGQNFQGMIDEVRVYNRALSVAEIQTDMVTAIGGGPPPDVTAPTIAITTPTGTGSYTATASPLTIGGTAADNIGVTQVTWASDRGGSGSATGTTAWSVSGIVLQPGANVVTVTARDAANNVATAALTVTYNVADTSPPVVAITAPTGGATYATKTSPVTLSGTAADNVGVTQVTWTNSAGGSGTAAGTTSWTASGIVLQTGANVLTVTARDAANNVGTTTLTVTLDAVAPTVALTAPGAGATLSGATTTITASASDNSAMAGVQMLLDGAALGAEVLGTGPTYTFTWNMAGTSNGPHTLSARARDEAGNTALAANVSVTVSNATPLGLVAAYGFEEVSGSTATDVSGNNNAGTFGSGVARTTSGRLGAGLEFFGNGKVTVPNSASLNLTTTMTLEAWVKPSIVNVTWRDVVYKSDDNYYLMAMTTTGSHPAGGGKFGGGTGTTNAFGVAALPVDTWTHLATTYDGAAIRLYVNGALVSSVARTGAIASSTTPLEIGGDGTYSQYFEGTIDEVRIYNRALSVSEIQTDMTAPITDAAPPPPLSVVGQWSAPFAWPLVGLHAALLKTGEVISWEFDGAGGPYLWNPTTGVFTSVPQGTNKFCAGQAALPDGRFLVVGGHIDSHVGLKELNIFDPLTRTWTAAPNMSFGRWYPTVTGLADGRSLIMSGETTCDGCNALIPEIYDPNANTVSKLTSASANFTYYPHMYVMPDSRVLAAASAEAPVVTKILNVATQTWSVVDPTPVDGGSSVMYLPGKIMKSGTSHNPDAPPDPSFATTYTLDMTQPSPLWHPAQPMAFPRTYHTLTLLPDGNVLATGGGVTTDPISPAGAVYAAELWSPTTQTWSTLSSGSMPRLYHSIAILLPDARVLVGSGGRFNGYPSNDPSDMLNAEIFSPGYLFKGARPLITSAPASAGYGATVTVQTPDAANVASVALIRLASVTHSFNTDQRFLPLTFTASGGSIDVQMPANANLAPPGHYMLFILNENGVPSTAAIIRMQ